MGVLVVAIALVVPASVSATPIFYSQLITSAHTCIGGANCLDDNDNSGQQNSVDTLGPQTGSVQGSTGATATGSASVVDGVLHASASVLGGSSFFDGANASGMAIFLDTLTFVSPSLTAGTSVQLAFAIDLDYDLSGACSATLPRSFVHAVLHSFSFKDDTCDAFDVSNGSGVITVQIGGELPFQAILTTDATTPGLLSGFANAANTFRFTIDPLGDFSYITASGNSYLTQIAGPAAVPEPATLLLIGSGTAYLAARRRTVRRRRQ